MIQKKLKQRFKELEDYLSFVSSFFIRYFLFDIFWKNWIDILIFLIFLYSRLFLSLFKRKKLDLENYEINFFFLFSSVRLILQKLYGYFNLSYISLFLIIFESIQKKKKKKNWNKDLKNYEINFFLVSSSDSIDRLILKKIEYIFLPFSYFFIFSFYTLIFEFHTSVLREKIIWIHLAKKKKINKKETGTKIQRIRVRRGREREGEGEGKEKITRTYFYPMG